MDDTIRSHQLSNPTLAASLKHPVRMMMILYGIAITLKILDSFVFRLGDLLGELIFTKALGFVMLIIYVSMCGRTLKDIGFHRRGVGRAVLISGVTIILLFAASFGIPLLVMTAGGADVRLLLTAVDPKTGMSGGLLFGLWLFFGNLVNSAMEEGLFRGAMMRHFRIKHSIVVVLFMQTLLFAAWHLDGPAKHLLTGTTTPSEMGMEVLSLLISTGIGGLVLGYLYAKTDSIWAPFVAHTINNSVLNFLFYRTENGLQAPYEFGLFIAIWLLGYLALIPVIGWWARRSQLPEITPWDTSFEEGKL